MEPLIAYYYPEELHDYIDSMEQHYSSSSSGNMGSYAPSFPFTQSHLRSFNDPVVYADDFNANHFMSNSMLHPHGQLGRNSGDLAAERASEATGRDGRSDRIPCTHHDCHKTFSRKADVIRHFKSAHEPEFIDCPRRRCDRKGEKGFTRPDHLKEHLRGYHSMDIPKRTTGGAGGGDGVGGGGPSSYYIRHTQSVGGSSGGSTGGSTTNTALKLAKVSRHASR